MPGTPPSRFSLHDPLVEKEPSRVFAATQQLGEQLDPEILISHRLALTDTLVTPPTSMNPSVEDVGSGVG